MMDDSKWRTESRLFNMYLTSNITRIVHNNGTTSLHIVGFRVITAVTMKSTTVLWVATPSEEGITEARNQQKEMAA
jgi:hypothetical protein